MTRAVQKNWYMERVATKILGLGISGKNDTFQTVQTGVGPMRKK